jgi:hypothetical protein
MFSSSLSCTSSSSSAGALSASGTASGNKRNRDYDTIRTLDTDKSKSSLTTCTLSLSGQSKKEKKREKQLEEAKEGNAKIETFFTTKSSSSSSSSSLSYSTAATTTTTTTSTTTTTTTRLFVNQLVQSFTDLLNELSGGCDLVSKLVWRKLVLRRINAPYTCSIPSKSITSGGYNKAQMILLYTYCLNKLSGSEDFITELIWNQYEKHLLVATFILETV